MKITPKKKGQIYDIVHESINQTIRNVEEYSKYLWSVKTTKTELDMNRIHYLIQQTEIPLAQKIIETLEK